MVYNLESSLSNDNIGHIFGSFGEIKEVSYLLDIVHAIPVNCCLLLENYKA